MNEGFAEPASTDRAPAQTRAQRAVHWIGLGAGPLLAALVYLVLPEEFRDPDGRLVPFTTAGRATLAVMVWMGTWWLTEAIDISATALLPIVVFPLLGIASIRQATAPYARDLIFLFMGGFLLALSMHRWGLDRRIALITLRIVGTRPRNMVAGFMLATAVMSAFVSNTATTAMMLPIALSVLGLVMRGGGDGGSSSVTAAGDTGRHFALCLMLGVAYAASIGGVTTIIGSPPNGILVGFMAQEIGAPYQRQISFAGWLLVGLPLAAIFLPLTWWLLTSVIYPIRLRRIEGGPAMIESEYSRLGPAGRGEWTTFVVFGCTALAWMFRPLLQDAALGGGEDAWRPLAGLSDAGIAMAGGLVLFVIPVDVGRRQFVMDWTTAGRLPWGILVLFGGGLSLAAAVTANGVAEFLASLTLGFAGVPPLAIVIVVVAAVIFLTELTSNTATTATLVPILAGLAPGLGVHPYLLIVPAALAASFAFMMPVATPPNAIVFASGHITIPQMCRAGLWLNLLGVAVIPTLMLLIVMRVLGVPAGVG
jgi:sodium-dependent dicarboxylate transporter 2/3/5